MPPAPGSDRPPYPFHDGCPKRGLPALYDELREAEAGSDIVLPDGPPARLVTRYADARHVLPRPEESSRPAAEVVCGYVELGQIMLALDGAEHAAVRAPAARGLTP